MPHPNPDFTEARLRALQADPVFQARVSEDPDILRHMNPPPDGANERAETMHALGSGYIIAGVSVPVPRLGCMNLLLGIDNAFSKADPGFQGMAFADLFRQIAEALFVLCYGPEAVAPHTMQFRLRRELERYRPLAEKSAAHLDACLRMERQLATELAAWDRYINEFAARLVVPEGGDVWKIITEIREYINAALTGMTLLPNIQQPGDDKKKRTASAGRTNMSQSSSRWRRLLSRVSRWIKHGGVCP